jgi:hypothetical protein
MWSGASDPGPMRVTRESMMNKKLIEMLTALATDSRVMAAFHADPDAAMAKYGLSERDMKEFIERLSVQPYRQSGVGTYSGRTPVTH